MRNALRFFWLFVVTWLASSCSDGGSSAGKASASLVSSEPRAAETASAIASVAPPASAAAPSPSAAEDASDRPQPFLWEAKEGPAASWLFGTMHLGTDAEKELHPIVFERLDAARVVVFEANVFDIDPFAAVELAMLPAGQTVKDKLSPGRWKVLVDRVGSILMPESSLERFKPWMLVTLILQDMLPKTDPMDGTLYERARKANKEIVFLETLEEQVKMVDKAMDAKLLDDTLADLPLAEKMLLDLASSYRAGDLEKLTTLTFDPIEVKKHPAMFETLLYERNRRWVPKLAPLLEKGEVFVAVGAAHLLGDKSVVALLAEKGYAIDRMKKPLKR